METPQNKLTNIGKYMPAVTAKARRNILRIIPFGLIWLIFSLVYSVLEKGLLGSLTKYPSTGNPYNFSKSIFVTGITALVIGLLIGTIEITYLHKLFRQKSFLKKMVYKTLVYLGIIIGFLLINTLVYNSVELKAGVFDAMVWNNVWLFFSSTAFWSVEVYIAAIIGVSLFYTEVSDNLGQGVLNNFLSGKYHTPTEEERIFMFLDMKSSTTIAENMGHVKYFEMLREYFADLTDPIINYSGEIYQYVGDEIVVTWRLKKGLADNNCIQCFFSMRAALVNESEKYIQKYGLAPGFKAGLHLGKVTTGEIGVIKKEIIFTGDVLNTTARIQGLCNAYGVDILISGQLAEQLKLPMHYQLKTLGENELRGRDEKIRLLTILQG